jgi:hypothetical protein
VIGAEAGGHDLQTLRLITARPATLALASLRVRE